MRRTFVLRWSILMLLLFLVFTPLAIARSIGIVTGSKTGTYIKFGHAIAKEAKKMGVDIIVKESEGSIANIERLNSRENAGLAIVQSDVLGFLIRSDDPEMKKVAERLRLIFPFYNEERSRT